MDEAKTALLRRGPVSRDDLIDLRPLTGDDAAGPYLKWMNDPDVTRYLESRFKPWTEGELRDYIQSLHAAGQTSFLAIVLRENGRHVGNIKLGPVNWEHARAEVGLIVGERDQWGRGIARRAITEVTRFGLRELGLARLVAGCYAPNEGSARAFVAAGWTIEGRLREHFVSDGKRVDDVLMGVLAREWDR